MFLYIKTNILRGYGIFKNDFAHPREPASMARKVEGDSECGPEEPPPQNYPFRSRPATNTQQYEPWPRITSAAAGM